MSEKQWKWYHTVGLLAMIVAIALFGLLIPAKQILLAWLLTLGALALFSMIAGHGITGRFWFGWLINEEYRMSLSRLQMFLWTVVVLSAFVTAALANIRGGHSDTAVAIAIPPQVWIAMGISTTSLVGSGLILGEKRKKAPKTDELVSLGLLTESEAKKPELVRQAKSERLSGVLQRNKSPKDARLYELVSGEEFGNADVLDLTRLQNLFFTLILIGSYAVNLGSMLSSLAMGDTAGTECVTASGITCFPPLHESAIALLGISHAGYLVAKAVDKQPQE